MVPPTERDRKLCLAVFNDYTVYACGSAGKKTLQGPKALPICARFAGLFYPDGQERSALPFAEKDGLRFDEPFIDTYRQLCPPDGKNE